MAEGQCQLLDSLQTEPEVWEQGERKGKLVPTPGRRRYLAQSLAMRNLSKLTVDDESNVFL